MDDRVLQLDLILETLEANEGFVARVPAVPGCTAWGASDGDAITNAKSVVLAMLQSFRDHRHTPPASLVPFLAADPDRIQFAVAVPLAA